MGNTVMFSFCKSPVIETHGRIMFFVLTFLMMWCLSHVSAKHAC
jgi:hypothetical protein